MGAVLLIVAFTGVAVWKPIVRDTIRDRSLIWRDRRDLRNVRRYQKRGGVW